MGLVRLVIKMQGSIPKAKDPKKGEIGLEPDSETNRSDSETRVLKLGF